MSENKAWKSWGNAFVTALASIIALVAYASTREWIIQHVGVYYVGFLEGFGAMVLIILFAIRYGDAITEFVLGIRELGKKSAMRKVRKESRRHKQTETQS